MADTLHITDGATTIDFDDATSDYSLKWAGWAPKVARVVNFGKANQPHIAEVAEELDIIIKGTTSVEVMSNLEILVGLIEQAGQWQAGSNVSPVELQYEISDSALAAPLESYITGPPDKGPIVTHPNHFDALKDGLVLQPVKLRFKRQGMWRGATDAQTDTNVAQNAIASVTFSEEMPISAPFSVKLDDIDTTSAGMPDGIILLAEEESGGETQLFYDEGEDGSVSGSGVSFAAFNDSLAPRGGNVGRITFTSGLIATVEWDLTTDIINQRLLGIVAMMKPTTIGRTYKIYATSENDGGLLNGRTYPTIELEGATIPRAVFLGYIIAPRQTGAHDKIQIIVEVDSFSGTPVFDIDCVAAIGMDNPNNRVISLLPPIDSNFLMLHLYPFSDESPTPLIELEKSGPLEVFVGWYGDAYMVSELAILKGLLLVGGDSARWVWVNGSGTALTPDWVITRTRAYLTPQ